LLVLVSLAALLALGACRGSREARLEEIRALQDAGLYAETVEPLREFVAQDPGQPEANYRLGIALLRTGQASRAVWPLHEAAASEAFGVPAGLAIASILLGQQQPEEAYAAASRVLEIESDHEGALAIRAQAVLKSAQYEQALADAERLVGLNPDRYQGLRAAALAALGRLDEAEQAYIEFERAAGLLDPQTASQACFEVARFYAESREDAERAGQQIELCLEPNPAHVGSVLRAVELYDDLEQPEQAMAVLRQAVEADPANLRLRQPLSDRLLADGEAIRPKVGTPWPFYGARAEIPTERARRSIERASSRGARTPKSCASSSPICSWTKASSTRRSASPTSCRSRPTGTSPGAGSCSSAANPPRPWKRWGAASRCGPTTRAPACSPPRPLSIWATPRAR
jgi:tetratricopeptide (TPR) repeat protein